MESSGLHKSECAAGYNNNRWEQQINTQQEFQTNLCNKEPPGDEVMVSCSTDQAQRWILTNTFVSEGFLVEKKPWKQRGEGEEASWESAGESDNENLLRV